MRRERGQALIEAVLAMPVCLVCALAVVDCGVIVRDRLATARAATHAAEAHLEGRDEFAAARAALPQSVRGGLGVDVEDDHVVVRVESSARITRLVGQVVEHRSSVAFDSDVSEVSR